MEENYIVSARKYRPATFATVVGQKALTATLKRSIATDKLAHAYLFSGSRGVGKTSCARIFAKTINCEHPREDGEACNECDSCRAFNEGTSLNIIELDAASNNSVDDIRALTDQVQVRPSSGRYRVFIVDEVHMLSNAAFNAFLKTLEEPPSYVVFILATTEKQKVIPTILSRCQIYDFNRITIADMVEHLGSIATAEGMAAEPAALNVIARKADGAMRDALSIFDQVAASSQGNITYAATVENLNVLDMDWYSKLTDSMLKCDVPQALLTYQEIRRRGFDALFFITGLAGYFRDLMMAHDPRTKALLDSAPEQVEQMAAQSAQCTPQWLYAAMDLCNKAELNYRTVSDKQFLVELTLIKLCQLCQADSPSPNDSGDGEGQLKPITPAATPSIASDPVVSYSAPAPKPAAAPAVTSTAMPVADARAVRPYTAETQSVRSSAPAPATPPAAAPRRRVASNLGPRVSINHADDRKKDTPAASAAASTTTQVRRATAYTAESLDAAWETYIARHPEAKLLIHTMRNCRPAKSDTPDKYIVTVESQPQMETMHNAMPDILQAIRMQLANDMITIDLDLNEGEGSPQTWSEREVFARMLEERPAMRRLAQSLKLTLD